MNNHTQPSIVEPPDPLGKMIQSRAWGQAGEEVSRRLALAQTPARRTFYYLFLANLSKRLVVESRRARADEQILKHLSEAESHLQSAIRESPNDISARNTFAEFHLKHRRDAHSALPLLDPFRADDEAPKVDGEFHEHKRLALRAADLALTGQTSAAFEHLATAYGPQFQSSLPSAYKGPLWYIALGGVQLPIDRVDALLDDLRKFQMLNERNLTKLRAALTAGMDSI